MGGGGNIAQVQKRQMSDFDKNRATRMRVILLLCTIGRQKSGQKIAKIRQNASRFPMR